MKERSKRGKRESNQTQGLSSKVAPSVLPNAHTWTVNKPGCLSTQTWLCRCPCPLRQASLPTSAAWFANNFLAEKLDIDLVYHLNAVLEDNTTVPTNPLVRFHGTRYFVVPTVRYQVVGTVEPYHGTVVGCGYRQLGVEFGR
jgi:hypothetical protein